MSLAALAQRREGQREHVEAVIEVLAEAPAATSLAQPAVGGREHAHVEGQSGSGRRAARPPLLQHAQQLGLQAERHLGDLVEQQRATLRLLELAGVGRLAPR
jgi:hypothetical protein